MLSAEEELRGPNGRVTLFAYVGHVAQVQVDCFQMFGSAMFHFFRTNFSPPVKGAQYRYS